MKLVPLGDIMDLDLDVVIVEPQAEYRLAGVHGFGRGLFPRRTIRGGDTSYKKLHRLHTGQVVLSRLKAFEGAVGIVPPDLDGCIMSPEFPTFSPRLDVVHPHYLAMLCEWPGLRELMQRASRGIGARRERVSAEVFLRLSVPLLAYEDQQRWGCLYAELQTGIRRFDERRNELLRSLPSSVLSRAFAER